MYKKPKYLFVKSSSLVATAPRKNADMRYMKDVVRVADNVPMGMDR